MSRHSSSSSITLSLPDDVYRFSFDSDEVTVAGSDAESLTFHEKIAVGLAYSLESIYTQVSRRLSALRHVHKSDFLPIVTRRGVKCLMPSFLRSRSSMRSASEIQTAKTTTKIAALDGLRGLACLFVFNEHYTYNINRSFLYGYGIDDRHTAVQLVPMRLFWSGFSMVAVFFVISGYVLSYKPLTQIRSRKFSELQSTVTSSVFRRAMRLFLPGMAATVLIGLFNYLGVFGAGRVVWNTKDNYLQLHEPPPPLYQGFFNQMFDAVKCSTWILNIWKWHDDFVTTGDYDVHTWTLPVEFRCSMALFLVQIGTARLRQNARLLAITLFAGFCVYFGQNYVQLFLAGMIIAELDMIRQDSTISLLPFSRLRSLGGNSKVKSLGWLLLFATGCYLCCVPVVGAESSSGFITLWNCLPSSLSDKGWFIRGLGAIAITWSAVNSSFLQPLFTNPVSAYLGQISFALYLVHGSVLKSVQYAALPHIYSATGIRDFESASSLTMVMAWLLGLLLVMPITIWTSDLFWRGIDVPSVMFARWFERALSEQDDELTLGKGQVSKM